MVCGFVTTMTKLFRPKCLIDYTRPFIYIGRLLLIYPYYITEENHLETSKIREWIIFVTTAFTILSFSLIQLQNHDINEPFNNPFVLLSLIRFIYILLNSFIYAIQIKINHKHLINIFKRYQKLEKYFGLSEADLKDIRNVSFLLAGISISILCSGLLFLHNVTENPWWWFFSAFSRCYRTILVHITDLTILVAFGLATKFASVIHRKIRDHGYVEKWEPILKRKMYSENRKPMLELRLAYRELLDIKEYINDAFSFQILALVTYVFIEAVFYTFLTIVGIQDNIGKVNLTILWTSLVYAFSIVIKFVALVAVCHGLKSKLLKTGRVVHDVFSVPQDQETREEVLILCIIYNLEQT